MDAHSTQPDSAEPPGTLADALQARRQRMQALATAQRQRLGQLE